jgi:putative endopeptidase
MGRLLGWPRRFDSRGSAYPLTTMQQRRHSTALLLLSLLPACADQGRDQHQSASEQDILAANLDPSVRPGDDFFRYATGRWMAANPIPASESSWTIGHLVNEQLYSAKRKINETAAASSAIPGSAQAKIGDFWSAAMDTARAEAQGTAPLAEYLKRIEAVNSPAQTVSLAAELQRIGVGALWTLYIGQDEKQSDTIAVMLYQGGLGLPDRDYYFNTEPGVAAVRAAYPGHIGRQLQLLGTPADQAQAAGTAVLAFETGLAEVSRDLEDLRDPYKNYNKLAVEALSAQHTPHIPWRAILDSYGLGAAQEVIVGQPEFFAGLDALLQDTPIAAQRDYLRFQLISTFAPYLSETFDAENFAFYGTVLQGKQEQRPRWKRVLDAQEEAMGMLVGQQFVQEYFPPHTKQRYLGLVEAIRETYAEHIRALAWMSPETKTKALAKLAAMRAKVGYPDHWKDMSSLRISRESYAANMLWAQRWHFDDDVAKFGKPVDRTEWEMTPQTYNAYYSPTSNEIVLPAGIFMIAGLRDEDADDAIVYGYAAASTIGHEITHGFDDQGRQYDQDGNLKDWWTAEDAERFNARAQVMVEQFNAYEPIPGLHINGEATLGENIADLGGVVLGLDAFKKTEQYKRGEKIAGLTPVQRYFLGYALGWLGHPREERLRQLLLSDVHSPAKYRVNGPFANLPEFYAAFGVKPGDSMWRAPEQRVHIW